MTAAVDRGRAVVDRVRGYDLPILLGVLAVLPLVVVEAGQTYQARLLVLFLIFALFAIALDIVFGQTDQLFLFVGSLAGIGAYTTALLADATAVTAWVFLPVGALVAGSLGFLVSYVAARRNMTIIVIAILTLSLQLAINEFFVGARSITGGSTGFIFRGLQPDPLVDLLGISPRVATYYVVLVLLAAVLVLYRRLMRSRYGLAFKAIRQDEVAAESVGINVLRYKVIAGFTAAVIIGLAGAMYAQTQGRVIPGMFEFQRVDVIVLIMLVLGGMRTLYGPIFGAAVIIYINESLQVAGRWRTAIFGGLLVVLFLYFRAGIVPKAGEVLRAAREGEVRALLRRPLERLR